MGVGGGGGGWMAGVRNDIVGGAFCDENTFRFSLLQLVTASLYVPECRCTE